MCGVKSESRQCILWESMKAEICQYGFIVIHSFRSAFLASFGSFIKRLNTSNAHTLRLSNAPKPRTMSAETFAQERNSHKAYIEATSNFVDRLVDEVVLPIIRWPLGSNYAKMVTVLGILKHLTEFILVPWPPAEGPSAHMAGASVLVANTWAQQDRRSGVISKGVSECLVACFASNYADIREKASEL